MHDRAKQKWLHDSTVGALFLFSSALKYEATPEPKVIQSIQLSHPVVQ
jgi:hypothetical protein